MEQKEIWIVSAKRTPMGKFQGLLADYSSPQLGALAIQGALEQAQLSPYEVDEVYMGCVLPAGCGQAPARQAALGGGLEQSTPCTTVNKVCGSGMKSVMLAHDLIKLGSIQCAVAGGMESMTNAPYLMREARSGMRMGHKTTYDHMFLDGLQDAYEGELMGVYGQQIADQLAFTREQMDEWATQSVHRALAADKQKMFGEELVSISLKNGETLSYDEQPRSIDANKIPKLKPAFAIEGSITAANSSAISDGAAALVLMESEKASRLEKKPLAIIKAHSTHARKPAEFTVAPVYAIEQLLSTLDWEVEDVDLWEINEAFAVVTQIAVKELQLDSSKVNIKGGACALGHPIGASGARILTTLIYSLRQLQAYGVEGDATKRKPMKGVAAICIGGGEATAIAIEIPV
ncbi:acetyl-CoA C-acyltransferase [Vibrio europaeus]|uniref:Acetyl-CoA C-acyltransferase n=1 Tax=Vibrio europaeus TaxID=300876 RepID=A0A178J5S8_9VIBR|nr:acetyl-CoA C-acyltransferase [Vibrio europaeus]MDC5706266.1 acetyl-CoA C-acyltransferase [Vibrio europaeus]MDC5709676.1 acetyl-CoA C-acyltransferase [Vibrio europaeus]MDC5714075.1 acetyl-CoA C-acyltransferase [Vibrio europaeus]MDC5720815.1 acetyl-CoA C-acyltransferase [Vibrio europaeus]MDC5723316.1 acetyl-CoA C-acyltransferase [Vibrio europaeus]